MGADSFIRRASGLLVPRMSFAAPWKFLPCEDCCGGPCTDAADCFSGVPGPTSSASIAGVANAGCTSGVCTGYNDSYTVTEITSGSVDRQVSLANPCPADSPDSTDAYLTFRVRCAPFGEGCRLTGSIEWNSYWPSGHPNNSDVKRTQQYMFFTETHADFSPFTTGVLYSMPIDPDPPFNGYWAGCLDAVSGGNYISCGGASNSPFRCDGDSATLEITF